MCIFADERGWYSVKPRKNQSGMKIAGNKISGVAELLKAATPVMAAVLMPLFLTAQPVMAIPTEPMRQVRELKGYRGLSADELAQCAWILCGREELGTRDARLALSGNLYSENLPACAPEAARSDCKAHSGRGSRGAGVLCRRARLVTAKVGIWNGVENIFLAENGRLGDFGVTLRRRTNFC